MVYDDIERSVEDSREDESKEISLDELLICTEELDSSKDKNDSKKVAQGSAGECRLNEMSLIKGSRAFIHEDVIVEVREQDQECVLPQQRFSELDEENLTDNIEQNCIVKSGDPPAAYVQENNLIYEDAIAEIREKDRDRISKSDGPASKCYIFEDELVEVTEKEKKHVWEDEFLKMSNEYNSLDNHSKAFKEILESATDLVENDIYEKRNEYISSDAKKNHHLNPVSQTIETVLFAGNDRDNNLKQTNPHFESTSEIAKILLRGTKGASKNQQGYLDKDSKSEDNSSDEVLNGDSNRTIDIQKPNVSSIAGTTTKNDLYSLSDVEIPNDCKQPDINTQNESLKYTDDLTLTQHDRPLLNNEDQANIKISHREKPNGKNVHFEENALSNSTEEGRILRQLKRPLPRSSKLHRTEVLDLSDNNDGRRILKRTNKIDQGSKDNYNDMMSSPEHQISDDHEKRSPSHTCRDWRTIVDEFFLHGSNICFSDSSDENDDEIDSYGGGDIMDSERQQQININKDSNNYKISVKNFDDDVLDGRKSGESENDKDLIESTVPSDQISINKPGLLMQELGKTLTIISQPNTTKLQFSLNTIAELQTKGLRKDQTIPQLLITESHQPKRVWDDIKPTYLREDTAQSQLLTTTESQDGEQSLSSDECCKYTFNVSLDEDERECEVHIYEEEAQIEDECGVVIDGEDFSDVEGSILSVKAFYEAQNNDSVIGIDDENNFSKVSDVKRSFSLEKPSYVKTQNDDEKDGINEDFAEVSDILMEENILLDNQFYEEEEPRNDSNEDLLESNVLSAKIMDLESENLQKSNDSLKEKLLNISIKEKTIIPVNLQDEFLEQDLILSGNSCDLSVNELKLSSTVYPAYQKEISLHRTLYTDGDEKSTTNIKPQHIQNEQNNGCYRFDDKKSTMKDISDCTTTKDKELVFCGHEEPCIEHSFDVVDYNQNDNNIRMINKIEKEDCENHERGIKQLANKMSDEVLKGSAEFKHQNSDIILKSEELHRNESESGDHINIEDEIKKLAKIIVDKVLEDIFTAHYNLHLGKPSKAEIIKENASIVVGDYAENQSRKILNISMEISSNGNRKFTAENAKTLPTNSIRIGGSEQHSKNLPDYEAPLNSSNGNKILNERSYIEAEQLFQLYFNTTICQSDKITIKEYVRLIDRSNSADDTGSINLVCTNKDKESTKLPNNEEIDSTKATNNDKNNSMKQVCINDPHHRDLIKTYLLLNLYGNTEASKVISTFKNDVSYYFDIAASICNDDNSEKSDFTGKNRHFDDPLYSKNYEMIEATLKDNFEHCADNLDNLNYVESSSTTPIINNKESSVNSNSANNSFNLSHTNHAISNKICHIDEIEVSHDPIKTCDSHNHTFVNNQYYRDGNEVHLDSNDSCCAHDQKTVEDNGNGFQQVPGYLSHRQRQDSFNKELSSCKTDLNNNHLIKPIDLTFVTNQSKFEESERVLKPYKKPEVKYATITKVSANRSELEKPERALTCKGLGIKDAIITQHSIGRSDFESPKRVLSTYQKPEDATTTHAWINRPTGTNFRHLKMITLTLKVEDSGVVLPELITKSPDTLNRPTISYKVAGENYHEELFVLYDKRTMEKDVAEFEREAKIVVNDEADVDHVKGQASKQLINHLEQNNLVNPKDSEGFSQCDNGCDVKQEREATTAVHIDKEIDTIKEKVSEQFINDEKSLDNENGKNFVKQRDNYNEMDDEYIQCNYEIMLDHEREAMIIVNTDKKDSDGKVNYHKGPTMLREDQFENHVHEGILKENNIKNVHCNSSESSQTATCADRSPSIIPCPHEELPPSEEELEYNDIRTSISSSSIMNQPNEELQLTSEKSLLQECGLTSTLTPRASNRSSNSPEEQRNQRKDNNLSLSSPSTSERSFSLTTHPNEKPLPVSEKVSLKDNDLSLSSTFSSTSERSSSIMTHPHEELLPSSEKIPLEDCAFCFLKSLSTSMMEGFTCLNEVEQISGGDWSDGSTKSEPNRNEGILFLISL